MGALEQGLYHHLTPMLQPSQIKIVTLNENIMEIITLDSCYGQSDKNGHFKYKYLGNITPCAPLSSIITQ